MKTPMLVTDFLKRARTVYRDNVAAVCGAERLTYGQLGERIDRFSNALQKIGVKRGDVVAYLSFNCHRLLEGYYAVPQIGAILLPINIRLTPPDIAYILNDAGASTVVVDRQLAGLLAPILPSLPSVKNVILMGGDPKTDLPIKGADYEALIAGAAAGIHPAGARRRRCGGAFLYERHDGAAQRRDVDASQPRFARVLIDGLREPGRLRRDLAQHPALPRERLGHAAHADDGGRTPRHGAEVRSGTRA